ncbi:MAG TPA: formylmethanofuran dehydrogenase subunit E family protein, partial [Deltaproteobacteria bacterium]|nr:formylmethanofuran dehydrogenase subunit E family protein [Deltaproteobacteria bacterium]
MVDIAQANLPQGELYDVICESRQCLPDAVQILTPCTIGNGWLRIVDTSRYAVIFFNKYTGAGVRVHLDAARLADWPALRAWFLKETPKKDQNRDRIIDEFRRAGTSIYGIDKVTVKPEFISSSPKKTSAVGICPGCGEAYRLQHGPCCPACQGKGPY